MKCQAVCKNHVLSIIQTSVWDVATVSPILDVYHWQKRKKVQVDKNCYYEKSSWRELVTKLRLKNLFCPFCWWRAHPITSLSLFKPPDNTLKPKPPPNEKEPCVLGKKIKREFLPSADTYSLDHVYSKQADSYPSQIEKDILINDLQRELKSV